MNALPPTYTDDDDISTAPFTSQPITKGLRNHPVKFVSATTTTAPPSAAPKPVSIADQYLAIVFPNGVPKPEVSHPICPTCGEPITQADERAHFLSLGHQMSLPRTHTPSAIDRSRMGLKYMEKFGFDVDARRGLGASGEGILHPIIPKEKRDTYGLGIKGTVATVGTEQLKEVLDAGGVKKKAAEEKKKAEKLRRMFYGDDDKEKYLEELEASTRDVRMGKGLSLGGFKVQKKKGKRR